uniref:Uncharacterized protein n=1 Tax=Knipowitschia caucasica TaxID=637954 RepID=A0AAV2M178_KNICA
MEMCTYEALNIPSMAPARGRTGARLGGESRPDLPLPAISSVALTVPLASASRLGLSPPSPPSPFLPLPALPRPSHSAQVSDCVEGVQRLFSNSLMMREKSNKGKMPARKCDMCRVIQGASKVAAPRVLISTSSFPHLSLIDLSSPLHLPFIFTSSAPHPPLTLPSSSPHPPLIDLSSPLHLPFIFTSSAPHPPLTLPSSAPCPLLICPSSSPHLPLILPSSVPHPPLTLPSSAPPPPLICLFHIIESWDPQGVPARDRPKLICVTQRSRDVPGLCTRMHE